MSSAPKEWQLDPGALKRAGIELFGDKPGWQSRLAESLGYDRSSVTRWLSGAVPVPMHASLLVRYMMVYGLAEFALREQV